MVCQAAFTCGAIECVRNAYRKVEKLEKMSVSYEEHATGTHTQVVERICPWLSRTRVTADHYEGLRWSPRHSGGIQAPFDCLCAYTLCRHLKAIGKQRFKPSCW